MSEKDTAVRKSDKQAGGDKSSISCPGNFPNKNNRWLVRHIKCALISTTITSLLTVLSCVIAMRLYMYNNKITYRHELSDDYGFAFYIVFIFLTMFLTIFVVSYLICIKKIIVDRG